MWFNFAIDWTILHIDQSVQLAFSDCYLRWIHDAPRRPNVRHRKEHTNYRSQMVRRWKNTVSIQRITVSVALKFFYLNRHVFQFIQRTNATVEENNAELINDSLAFFILSAIESVVQLIAGVICVDCFNQAAINQTTRIRIAYFASLMRQDVGWYDIEKGKSNFTVRLAE